MALPSRRHALPVPWLEGLQSVPPYGASRSAYRAEGAGSTLATEEPPHGRRRWRGLGRGGGVRRPMLREWDKLGWSGISWNNLE